MKFEFIYTYSQEESVDSRGDWNFQYPVVQRVGTFTNSRGAPWDGEEATRKNSAGAQGKSA